MNTIPTYLGSDEPLCGQCSRESGGCCVTSLDDAAYCFPLSEAEIQRLLPYAHLAGADAPAGQSSPVPMEQELTAGQKEEARQQVCAPEPNSPVFLQSMGYLFPRQQPRILAFFPPEDIHFRLRLDQTGACVFLGEQGCRLPRHVRPWYCLLFPAWFQDGSLTIFLSDDCLATRGAEDPLTALERLNITEKSAKEIFGFLIADWGFPEK